jgi:tripartite-type tricarboxylate transporter receptor subunit TctC
MLSRRSFIAAGAIGYSCSALGQTADSRSIKIIVPFAAGGNTDVVARLLADGLSAKLKRPVIVENRPGAGVVVGTNAVARAEPDGTTLLFTTVSHAINPALQPRLPYDSKGDFVAIARVATVPLVLSVTNSFPAKTLTDFLNYVRVHPKAVSYGSAGIGSALHMAAELLSHQAGLEVAHVPYRGAGPAMNDLIGGQIQFIIDPISTSAPQISAGNIRALAVTSDRRSPTLPDIPTFREAGMPDYEASTWNVVLAPKGASAEIVRVLNQTINLVLTEPAVMRRLEQYDVIPVSDSTPASTATFLDHETQRWTGIIRSSGIKLEN